MNHFVFIFTSGHTVFRRSGQLPELCLRLPQRSNIPAWGELSGSASLFGLPFQ
jgi:hypothetical protein